MESNYRNREFEQYIKENADQYRMFPSEKVWKGIHNTLHTRRRRYGIGLALLLLVTGSAVTWVMMSYPVAKNEPVTSIKAAQSPLPQKSTAPALATPEAVTKVPPFNNKLASIKATPGQSPVASPLILPAIISEEIRDNLVTLTPAEQPAGVIRIDRMQLPGLQKEVPAAVVNSNPFYQSVVTNQAEQAPSAIIAEESIKTIPSDRPNVRNEFNYPLGYEDVTNAYIPQKISRRVSWQFFVTPTISYRKLDENKKFDNDAGFPFASLTDVNKAVTHKPDMGLQIGLSARYPVTRNLKIRGGLQFNLNRYDIKAFAYNPEVATIELNGTNGNSSVSTWTEYRTYSGYKSDWLKNFYFSVSAPIGAELTLVGNKKTSFGIAGTIQPTYIIKDRAYLISSDYKNYAKVPWLIRHVNLNTGFEAFVNYTSGKTKWQVGPQVRYQVLSSFHNKYPVKENLFDFGMKIGITLNE
jgi:hypothetical protein